MFLSSTCYDVFCRRTVAACFDTDLLRRVVVLSTVSFFVGFRIDNSNDKVQSNRVIRSNPVRRYVVDLES